MKSALHGTGIYRGAALLLSGFLALMSLTSCGGEEEEAEEVDQTINVDVLNPERRDFVLHTDFMGMVSPEDTVKVIPKASGEATGVFFEIGDHVNAGDVLFTIDDTAAQINLAVAQAGAASAEAQVRSAQITAASAELKESSTIDSLNNEKVQQLVDQQGDMEDLDTRIKNAELAVKQAEISLNTLNDSKSTLKGRRNSLDNALDEIDDALKDATDSAERAILNDRKAELQNSRDSVKASQESLDDQIANASMTVQQAKNDLERAKEAKANAQGSNLVKNTETDRNIASTMEELQLDKENAKAQESIAKAGVESAAVSVEQAELNLSYYTVKAPISGYIQSKKVELHNTVSSSEPAYVIVNQDSMTVTFDVSEDVMKTLSIGQKVTVDRNGALYEGRITEIADAADQSTGLFAVKASVTDQASELSAGTAVMVTADTYSSKNALLIPYASVYYEDGSAYVYTEKDGKAAKTYIQTGLFDYESIEVLEGLTEEDKVITTWAAQMSDGADVRIISKTN